MSHFLLRTLLLVFLVAPFDAQGTRERRDRSGSDRRRDDAELRELRERWHGKSDEERALLRQRFEQLKNLSPEEREALGHRARRLRDLEREVRKNASEEERAEAEKLAPPRERDFWRHRAVEHSRYSGRQLREKLPPELLDRLEGASRWEKMQILDEFRERERDSRSRSAVVDLGRRVGLSHEEIRAIEELPFDRRISAVVELKRKHIEDRVRSDGLPRGIDEATWESMRSLSDKEFLESFHRSRGRGGPPDGRQWPGMRPPDERMRRGGFRDGERSGPGRGDRPPPRLDRTERPEGSGRTDRTERSPRDGERRRRDRRSPR